MFRSAAPKFSKTQMLDSKPIQLAPHQLTQHSETTWRLTVPLHPTRNSPQSTTARNLRAPLMRLARLLLPNPSPSTKIFELDHLGLFVWTHCDGQTPVRHLIQKLSTHYNLNLREAEVATVQFLHTLAKKGLIRMKVTKSQSV
ncbi:MAG TPA: PqqD family protein [Tepidisphaeraceae bacterium]|jgi:hypothetical protein